MLNNSNDLGAALYKTWTEQQRSDEINKLVQGYRNGLPIGIVCTMTEAVAGNKKKAKKYLARFMTTTERTAAIASVPEEMAPRVKTFLS